MFILSNMKANINVRMLNIQYNLWLVKILIVFSVWCDVLYVILMSFLFLSPLKL